MSFGKIPGSGHHIRFEIEIDRTAGPGRTNDLQASIKGGKLVFSRAKESSLPGFLKNIADFFTKQKTDTAKSFVKTHVIPILKNLTTSRTQKDDLLKQAFDKNKPIDADLFMNILSADNVGIYHFNSNKSSASVIISDKPGST